MKVLKLMSLIFILTLSRACSVQAMSMEDPRYCGFVPRDKNGDIKRSSAVINKFRSIYKCPSTGLNTGPCPDWSLDHVIPLTIGGCDSIQNMHWLPNVIKNCSLDECKDRWERHIYPVDPTIPGFNPKCCPSKLIKFEN